MVVKVWIKKVIWVNGIKMIFKRVEGGLWLEWVLGLDMKLILFSLFV